MNRHQRRADKVAAQKSFVLPSTREHLTRLIAVTQADGQVGRAQLFRDVLARKIALVGIDDRSSMVTAADLNGRKRPVVVLIGDDDNERTTGPDGWACAETVAAWAKAAVVHGAAPSAESYAAASEAAVILGSCALVETSSRFVEAWGELFAGKPLLGFVPPEGCVHPTGIVRGTRH